MKNHKGNNGSMEPKKDGGFNKPEKHTEPGKGGMQQPGKGMPGKGMNDGGKGYQHEENEEKEEKKYGQDKSKYFGNYQKTCDTCGSSKCRCD